MKVPFYLLILIGFLLSGSTSFAQGPPGTKMDDELLNAFAFRDGQVRYLVQLDSKADLQQVDPKLNKTRKGQQVYTLLKQHADQAQKELISFLETRQIPHQSFFIVNAVMVRTDFATAEQIAAIPQVRKLVYDPVIRHTFREEKGSQASGRGSGEPEWGLRGIGAEQVWSMGFEGQGVVIGGADTGVEWVHSTISQQYRGNQGDTVVHDYNWHDAIHEISPLHNDTTNDASLNPCGLEVNYPCDDNNHGTHTVGTMVGRDTANQIGVAPEAKWIACRNMERGWGSPSTYIECFEWFLAPTDQAGENPDPEASPDVINNSWRCPEIEGCNESNFSLIQDAVRALKQAGIFVVVSAGNEGPSCFSIDSPPAIFDESFSVGAHASNDTIAAFSSRGPIQADTILHVKPDIAAPGVSVRSAIRNQGFASFSGTSMAGPHVAGTVALMISANPQLRGQVDAIEQLLINTAIPVSNAQDCGNTDGSNVPNNTYGYGLLDALGAVEAAINFTVSTEKRPSGSTVTMFPNPARETIQWTVPTDKVVGYRIYDLHGRQVMQGNGHGTTGGAIRVGHLQQGFYVIHFQGLDKTFTGKFTIAR